MSSFALKSVLLAGVAALFLAPAAFALDVAALKPVVEAKLDQDYPALEAYYKDLHTHPEIAFQEVKTAAKLAAQLRALGFEVTEKVGKTGVVAIYKNGPGPVILVRTELDALPVEEKTGLPYASHDTAISNGKQTFVDHACGHDIHMTVMVGTARQLVALKDKWSGTLMFIGQPAEEVVRGAKAMIDDGLFSRFPKPDYGFALHVGPGPMGHIEYRAGVMSSNSNGLEITFKGKGGHGSMPSVTIDPILEAAHFIVDVQSVISREKDAQSFGVITIGAVQAGTVGNIIPDHAVLHGTVRSYTPEVRQVLLTGIRRTANAVAEMAGAPAPEIDLSNGGDAIVNSDAVTAKTAPVFKAVFGDRATVAPGPWSASEDYSDFIAAGVPSLYFSLGGSDPVKLAEYKAKGEFPPVNHSPYFAPVPEPSIKTGVEAMTFAVLNMVQK